MPKFVCLTANKAECELENGRKARLRMNLADKAEQPPMNPPHHKPDPFAPKVKTASEPKRITAPVGSAIRGDAGPKGEPTNAEIMAFLLKTLGK